MRAGQELKNLANPDKAKFLQKYFKTGKGDYGEGDLFLGVTVPQIRKLAGKYRKIELKEVISLLHSEFHEERLMALLIMVLRFQAEKDDRKRERICGIYLKNKKYINNWDLVDLSCHKILGVYLADKPKTILYDLARSKNLWERRVSVISTLAFIKNDHFAETIKIAKMLLRDNQDLIHKAVGWALREIGKRNLKAEEDFLNRYCQNMPRTMLRYAIERFPRQKRKHYLNK